MAKKEQFCFWCGESLGWFVAYGAAANLETCGAQECEREARYAQQSEQEDRRAAAEQDDYEQYRNRY